MDWLFTLFENATLFGVFLVASMIGVGIFVIAYILDGILDGLLDLHFGEVSFPIVQFIGVFLATAGGSGLITLGLGLNNTFATLLVSILIGVALSGLFAFSMNRLQKAANREYALDTESVIGSEVPVSWWRGDHGEVLISLGGNLFKVPAESEETLVNTNGRFTVASAEFSGDRPIKVVVKEL